MKHFRIPGAALGAAFTLAACSHSPDVNAYQPGLLPAAPPTAAAPNGYAEILDGMNIAITSAREYIASDHQVRFNPVIYSQMQPLQKSGFEIGIRCMDENMKAGQQAGRNTGEKVLAETAYTYCSGKIKDLRLKYGA